jgi:hypothetical protein
MITQLNAHHYCEDLLRLDDQILTVAIFDQRGEILAIDWKKDKVPWEGSGINAMNQFEEISKKLGVWVKLILGLAEQTTPLIGGIERVSFTHRKFQLVLLSSPSQENDIGLMLTRSANIDHLAIKIKELIG